MTSIKVSIVVPIYNQEKYLQHSINSILSQNYANLDIVLVNDGSTDNSLNIIRSFADADHRITIVDKTNGGLVDATIAGIERAVGNYICFMDPDDYIGDEYIANFINLYDKNPDLDFYAAGFYKDNYINHLPFCLNENKIYDQKSIVLLRNSYIFDGNSLGPSQLYHARWNKMYKAQVVIGSLEKFKRCKNISLGEDSIFTYLVLCNSRSGLTTTLINSYYYNIGNQNSITKKLNVADSLTRSRLAFECLENLMEEQEDSTDQAYILYYNLTLQAVSKAKGNKKQSTEVFDALKSDEIYTKSLKLILQSNISMKKKIAIRLFCASHTYSQYAIIKRYMENAYSDIKIWVKTLLNLTNAVKRNGIIKGVRQNRFYVDRLKAPEDIREKLPLIEERINKIISNFEAEPENHKDIELIEKNIFIFWWDGFENAPAMVKGCLESVKRAYNNYNILLISKDNYKEYTTIHPRIIDGFEKGKISIQTFSDILRFNLLYNHGGIWTDATIYYREKLNLLENLEHKSFESLNFSYTSSFLRYKETSCSWSGFLIASRRHGLFIQTMNYIFEQYYLKYGSYDIYYFIDAAFMICKINGVDNNVLDKVQTTDENMFDLSRILNYEYYKSEFNNSTKIPQKLSWFMKINSNKNYFSNYDYITQGIHDKQ